MLVRTPADLGNLIRQRRKELGLDQGSLAARVGVSRLWINEIEQGKPRAAVGLVLRTLTVLGLALDAITEDATAATPRAKRDATVTDLDAIVQAARKKP